MNNDTFSVCFRILCYYRALSNIFYTSLTRKFLHTGGKGRICNMHVFNKNAHFHRLWVIGNISLYLGDILNHHFISIIEIIKELKLKIN